MTIRAVKLDLNKLEVDLINILKENNYYDGIKRYDILTSNYYNGFVSDYKSKGNELSQLLKLDDELLEYNMIDEFIKSIKGLKMNRSNHSPKLRHLKSIVSKEYYNYLRSLNLWDVGYIHSAIVVYLILNYQNIKDDSLKKEYATLIYYLILEDEDIFSCLYDTEGNVELDFIELLDFNKELKLDSTPETLNKTNTKIIDDKLNRILSDDNVLLVIVTTLLKLLRKNMISFVGAEKVKDEISDFRNELLNKLLVKKSELKYKDNYIKNSRGWWD